MRDLRNQSALPAALAAALFASTALCAPAGSVTMDLAVDATQAPRRLLRSRMTIPVKAGPLTLQYPKWLPGEHGPTGPITDVAGLEIRAGSRLLSWRRDPTDMYAFRCEVPAGTTSIEVALDFLSPPPRTRGSPLEPRPARTW